MEKTDTTRPGGITSLVNLEQHNSRSKSLLERFPPSVPDMATVTVTNPLYPSHPPPPYSHHAAKFPAPLSLSGIMSPPESHSTESRRPSDDAKDIPSNRQSLPSLQEALSRPATSTYAPTPSTPNSMPTYQSSIYTTSQPPTPSDLSKKNDFPPYQTHMGNHSHATRNSPPRSNYAPTSHPRETDQAPVDRNRHQPLPSLRTALPNTATYAPYQENSAKQESDLRSWDRRGPMDSYTYRFGEGKQYPYSAAASEGPSSGFVPRSPMNLQRDHYSPRESEFIHIKNGQPDFNPPIFKSVLDRSLGNFDMEMALSELKSATMELSSLANYNFDTVKRYQQSGPAPRGIPSARDLEAMQDCQRRIDNMLQTIRYFTTEQQQQTEKRNSQSLNGRATEHDDNWGSDDPTGLPEAKKRRGRAAPPGRCHSCNRAETPEWRRGPDGARTLCNACGLHYAKLTRKSGTKQIQSAGGPSRPKSMDDASPV